MIDTLIEKYVALRDKKAQMEAAHKLAVAPVNEAMDKVEAVLLNAMNEQGLVSFKASAGTAYKSEKTGARIADKDSLREFLVKQEDPFHFLDLKVSKTAVEEFLAENEVIPPGVDYYRETTVNIRRA